MVAPATITSGQRGDELPFDQLMKEFSVSIPEDKLESAEALLATAIRRSGGRMRQRSGEQVFLVDDAWTRMWNMASEGTLPPEVFVCTELPYPGSPVQTKLEQSSKPPDSTVGARLLIVAKERDLLTPQMVVDRLREEFPEATRKLCGNKQPGTITTYLVKSYGLKASHREKIGKMNYNFFTWQGARAAFKRLMDDKLGS